MKTLDRHAGVVGPSPQARREHPEPAESNGPLPAMFLVFLGVLGSFGASYLLSYSGEDFGDAGDRRSAPSAVAAAPLTGQALFEAHCSACHQSTGQGVPGSFPPLAGSPWLGEDPQTPIRVVLLGLQGPIEVLGAKYGTSAMPRFADRLGDEEIARILSYARGAWGNTAGEINEAEVKDVRAMLGTRTTVWQGGCRPRAPETGDERGHL